MEPFAAGWLSILPPIIAIILALITKEVFSSLLIGIFSGACIYTFGSGVPDPLIKMLDVTFSLMGEKVDFQILLFCILNLDHNPYGTGSHPNQYVAVPLPSLRIGGEHPAQGYPS